MKSVAVQWLSGRELGQSPEITNPPAGSLGQDQNGGRD